MADSRINDLNPAPIPYSNVALVEISLPINGIPQSFKSKIADLPGQQGAQGPSGPPGTGWLARAYWSRWSSRGSWAAGSTGPPGPAVAVVDCRRL